MAGIGFVLRRVVAEDTYVGQAKGYLYAALISSGPWLLSVVTLAFLGVLTTLFLPNEERNLFFATLTYAFAFSLITTGIVQMVITRYLADKLFVKETAALSPTFASVLCFGFGVQFASGVIAFLFVDVSWLFRFSAGNLYAAVSCVWLAMLFLSAAKAYLPIVRSFLIGYMASLASAYLLGSRLGIDGALAGFAVGQMLLLALLWARIMKEFGQSAPPRLEWLGHFGKYKSLVLIGLAYNLGMWIDKLVFWFSHEGVAVKSFLHVFPVYDISMFLAYLTIVPALAIFLVNVETDFFDAYRGFYSGIIQKSSLAALREKKGAMSLALKRGYGSLLMVQAWIVFFSVAFAPQILQALGFFDTQVFPLRLGIIGASIQAFTLVTLLVLLYFDLRGSALLVSVSFLVTNLAFTLITLRLDFSFYGYGFLFSSMVALLLAMTLLCRQFSRLEYLTFTRQPIATD